MGRVSEVVVWMDGRMDGEAKQSTIEIRIRKPRRVMPRVRASVPGEGTPVREGGMEEGPLSPLSAS